MISSIRLHLSLIFIRMFPGICDFPLGTTHGLIICRDRQDKCKYLSVYTIAYFAWLDGSLSL